MPLQGNLSVERMCDLVPVSRAGFYRYLQPREPDQEEMAVRAAIQEVALQHRRRYGCRRITAELRQRGMRVNRKRVLRIMREDDLLAIRRRKYVQTTDSDCALDVYLNLASRMSPSFGISMPCCELSRRRDLRNCALRYPGGGPVCAVASAWKRFGQGERNRPRPNLRERRPGQRLLGAPLLLTETCDLVSKQISGRRYPACTSSREDP